MDPRLLPILARERGARCPGLAGSGVRASLRISTALLNEAIAAYAASASMVKEVFVTPRAANHFDVRLKLAKPAFLPAFNITVAIEQQPELPANPVLVLHLTGAGGMLRLAGPAVTSSGMLPPGVRLDADRVFIDVHEIARHHGQAELLDYAEQLEVTTEEGSLILQLVARVP